MPPDEGGGMEVIMNGISSYGAFLGNHYDNTIQNKRTNTTKQAQDTKEKEVKLSDKAKDLLKELRQKYGNIDFIVANYETDEEADAYLSRGTNEFSVLIDPEELEKMSNDDETKNKNLGIIEEAREKLTSFKEDLGDKKDEVKRFGVSMDKNGNVSFFAELETLSEKQRERIEESKEEKGGYIRGGRVKRTRVTASSTEELLDKVNKVDWSKIKEEKQEENKNRLDFSI